MTLVAGRMPTLHSYGEDISKQGILKTGPTHRPNKPEVDVYYDKPADNNSRQDDSKRLVRFCEAEDSKRNYHSERNLNKAETQDVIKFSSNMYVINNSDPNSAVRKLFPNSKLTPINPFVNKMAARDRNTTQSAIGKTLENNYNQFNSTKARYFSEDTNVRDLADKKTNSSVLRRNLQKTSPEMRLNPKKGNASATPLIERIKQLTCEDDETPSPNEKSKAINKNILQTPHIHRSNVYSPPKLKLDLSKPKENPNLTQYNKKTINTRPQSTQKQNMVSPNKTDEARRSFLSSLSQQHNDGMPGDRSSVATNSTIADTVYSLSDIEEVLTEEEEKEIKEAFSQEIKQDELELFVQQDAGRTERLRKRYSSTPKPESQMPKTYCNSNFSPLKNQNLPLSYYTGENTKSKIEKPKFGSTIEILQQLQQQIETPYQLEGRRTACSNYSDSSIPISDRLLCDEPSDGYEQIVSKPLVHRTCSLDSKNYEEIDHFPSAFSVPRTKSHEHPRLSQVEPDQVHSYPCNSNYMRYPGSFHLRNQQLQQNIYASSPDLHGLRQSTLPDRVSSYNNHPLVSKQLHPVLQRQYCRYPLSNAYPSPAEEGKVLTPPVRMHTYMNIPQNAPCYPSPPPYSQINSYMRPPSYSDIYYYEPPHTDSSIYQNIPFSKSTNMMSIQRFCTERERGVPEGASSSQDSKELYQQNFKDAYSSTNHVPILKPSSLPHHYCVDV